MKRILTLVIAAAVIIPACMAFDKKKKPETAKTEAGVAADDGEIRWMNLDEVQAAMAKQPKRVFIDVYTDWCGWCKVMDKKTFTNKHVIRYLNEHFYAVKFNAEQPGTVRFLGKMYSAGELASSLLQGQMSYPTSVIMEPNFQNPQPIPGYLDVAMIEMVLKYLNEEHYKTTPWPDWQKNFKGTWM